MRSLLLVFVVCLVGCETTRYARVDYLLVDEYQEATATAGLHFSNDHGGLAVGVGESVEIGTDRFVPVAEAYVHGAYQQVRASASFTVAEPWGADRSVTIFASIEVER